MLIREIITETSAGGVATVVMPMNSDIIKRPGPVVKKKKKKKKAKNEGKSPHKKGTKKYKKHMAAMHAG